MNPVGNAYISYTDIPQKKFLSQKMFSSCQFVYTFI